MAGRLEAAIGCFETMYFASADAFARTSPAQTIVRRSAACTVRSSRNSLCAAALL